MSDPLHTLLDELAPDVAHARLADPAAVRRRGEQRTHRRIAGSVLVGGAAVIAVALLAPGPLHSLADNPAPPAATPTPTVPSVASPSGSATVAQTARFLTPAQLPGPATTGATWRLVGEQASSAAATCVDPTGPGAYAASVQWFATGAHPAPGDEVAVERVLNFESAGRASTALASLLSSAQACAYDADPVLEPRAGDEAKALYFRYHDGAVGAASMQSLVVVRVGARLAVLIVAMDGNGDIPYIDDLQKKMPVTLAQQLSASTASSSVNSGTS